MLTINEIKKQYPENMHRFNRGLVREYLQYQILSIIYEHQVAQKLIFLGGTCLRIVYGSKRFSEDLDFDNKGLNESDFVKLSEFIKKELERLGFEVEIKIVQKRAFHCYIKFPKLLYEHGLFPLEEDKILIQLDTFDQGVYYEKKRFILDKFDIFKQIFVASKEIILAQKIWTITRRKRLKGRDFYDIMFLMQNTTPDLTFLKKKFKIKTLEELETIIMPYLENIDWDKMVEDVAPFLINHEDADRIKLFPKFVKQKFFVYSV